MQKAFGGPARGVARGRAYCIEIESGGRLGAARRRPPDTARNIERLAGA
jgi:hypothetical protein